MVLSKQFAQLSAKQFSFFAFDIRGVDELGSDEKEQVKQLMKENKITATPSLLFLNPESLGSKYLYHEYQDLEPAIIVQKISAELNRSRELVEEELRGVK